VIKSLFYLNEILVSSFRICSNIYLLITSPVIVRYTIRNDYQISRGNSVNRAKKQKKQAHTLFNLKDFLN
jgi:hypothetical protein